MENTPIASLSDLELATKLAQSMNGLMQANREVQIHTANITNLQAEIEKRQPKPEEKKAEVKKK
jgi:multidrug resistance efflux pump